MKTSRRVSITAKQKQQSKNKYLVAGNQKTLQNFQISFFALFNIEDGLRFLQSKRTSGIICTQTTKETVSISVCLKKY